MRQEEHIIYLTSYDLDTDEPVRVLCPYCNVEMFTRVVKRPGIGAWLASGLIMFLGFFCGCCLVPFCLKAFQEFKHYCTNCCSMIGKGHGFATC